MDFELLTWKQMPSSFRKVCEIRGLVLLNSWVEDLYGFHLSVRQRFGLIRVNFEGAEDLV